MREIALVFQSHVLGSLFRHVLAIGFWTVAMFAVGYLKITKGSTKRNQKRGGTSTMVYTRQQLIH
jgi:hypothetical protein